LVTNDVDIASHHTFAPGLALKNRIFAAIFAARRTLAIFAARRTLAIFAARRTLAIFDLKSKVF
jgi:hypothetical protein